MAEKLLAAAAVTAVSASASAPRSNKPWAQAQATSQPAEGSRQVREVWAWNFEEEFASFMVTAVQPCLGGVGAVLALDIEFPGFLRETSKSQAPAAYYQALRENVDLLWPIQIGVAVANYDGTVRGVWSFNLRFDAAVDAHSKSSVAFLSQAGIDFERHRAEGIQAAELGRRLAASLLVGPHEHTPYWLTFSGLYDLGYLLKILTSGRPLPSEPITFNSIVSMYCPRRCDLRDILPVGSLEMLGKKHGVKRYGAAHTAGSDALLTLELYFHFLEPEATNVPRPYEKGWGLDDWSSWGRDRLWNSNHTGYGWEDNWTSQRWPFAWQYHAAAAAASAASISVAFQQRGSSFFLPL